MWLLEGFTVKKLSCFYGDSTCPKIPMARFSDFSQNILANRYIISAPKPKKKATRVLKTDIPPPPSRNTTPQSSRPSSTAPSQRRPVPSTDASTTGTSTPISFEGENKSRERVMRDDGLPIGSTMVSTPSETPVPQERR